MGRVRDKKQWRDPPLKETGGPGTVRLGRGSSAGVIQLLEAIGLCCFALCPGRYSAPEAGGEIAHCVNSAISRSHPCTCPCDFRVRLYGRSGEGPILTHAPPRKMTAAAGVPIVWTKRLCRISPSTKITTANAREERGRLPPSFLCDVLLVPRHECQMRKIKQGNLGEAVIGGVLLPCGGQPKPQARNRVRLNAYGINKGTGSFDLA